MDENHGRTSRIRRNHLWGLGVYANPRHFRYLAIQVGPWYVYLYNEEPKNPITLEEERSPDSRSLHRDAGSQSG